jgi:ABC-type polysaccharide/polyol phosphate transport system ATPase subunit
LRAEGLSKVYRLYARPQDRLKELALERFGRRFSEDFWALRDVSLEVGRGRRLGVIGRNGSGKSTLLQIIAGTLGPSAGTVEVSGRVAALLELGSGFNPEYTGRENVYLNAAILGLSREQTDERFDDIAAFADIGAFMDQPVKTYSSGMFMRLAFSVTTSVDADVLLVDEALSVGDAFFTQKCFRHLERLIDRGVTVVLVSHDTSAVNQFCDGVVVLDAGRVVYQGDTVGGLRTYFALQRSASAPVPRVAGLRVPVERAVSPGMSGWPAADAFLPLEGASMHGTGQARCTAVALCDADGTACNVFDVGHDLVVYTEFEVLEPMDVPVGGVSLVNERNVIVHGRNTLQHGCAAPSHASPGARLRFRQRIRLDVAPGRYTFLVGLASVPAAAYDQAQHMSHASLHGESARVLSVAGEQLAFAVSLRRDGLELPFHGLCGLEGDASVEVRAPEGTGA